MGSLQEDRAATDTFLKEKKTMGTNLPLSFSISHDWKSEYA